MKKMSIERSCRRFETPPAKWACRFLFPFLCLLCLPLASQCYPYNPHVPCSIWDQLEPYFLPLDHPLKKRLDKLFQKQRITESAKTFEEAGFGKPKARKPTNIFIGHHPDFPKYIFKVFLDSQPPVCEWENWIRR